MMPSLPPTAVSTRLRHLKTTGLVLPRSRSSLSTKSRFFGTYQSWTSRDGVLIFRTAVPHCPAAGSNAASPVAMYRCPAPSVETPPRPHTPPPQKSFVQVPAVYSTRTARPGASGSTAHTPLRPRLQSCDVVE